MFIRENTLYTFQTHKSEHNFTHYSTNIGKKFCGVINSISKEKLLIFHYKAQILNEISEEIELIRYTYLLYR